MTAARAGRRARRALLALGAWLLLVGVALGVRPVLPVDETRYLAVAWEMWLRGDLLVPHLNGVPYSEKPPLLFWLIDAGWGLFGVNAWWPRLVPALFGLASLGLAALLARRLWPERPEVAAAAPLVLLGSLAWTVYASLLMFDLLIAACTLFVLLGVLAAWRGQAWGWALAGVAAGLGLLAKGPVVLIAPGGVILLAPWWGGRAGPPGGWWRWALGALGALALAAGIGLAWALPAAAAGGDSYGAAILFRQTEQRVLHDVAHPRPWWWYLALLPLMLYPYSLWAPLWRRLRPRRAAMPDLDLGTRFCLAWALPSLVTFSLISGKQPHYLLPLLPAAALLVARGTAGEPSTPRWQSALPALPLALAGGALALAPALGLETPDWIDASSPWFGALLLLAACAWVAAFPRFVPRSAASLGLLSVLLVLALHGSFAGVAARRFDLTPVASHLRRLEAQGRPLAYVGHYQGQFHFLGRLRRPLVEIPGPLAAGWLRQHPGGRVIEERDTPPRAPRPELSHPYRDQVLVVWGPGPLPPELGG